MNRRGRYKAEKACPWTDPERNDSQDVTSARLRGFDPARDGLGAESSVAGREAAKSAMYSNMAGFSVIATILLGG